MALHVANIGQLWPKWSYIISTPTRSIRTAIQHAPMAKRTISEPQHEILVGLLQNQANGLSLAKLLESYEGEAEQPISERTMRRRLRELEDAGRVRSEGLTRAVRYFAVDTSASPAGTEPRAVAEPRAKAVPRTTPEPTAKRAAAEPRAIAAEPIQNPFAAAPSSARVGPPAAQRARIAFDSRFLGNYEPGDTWYLSEDLRARLQEMGRTGSVERPAGAFARDIMDRLLVDLSWASSKLEGNTYSLAETKSLLEQQKRTAGKTGAESQMILNHQKAIELLVAEAADIEFNRHTLLNLHAAVSENLLDDPHHEGRLRTRAMEIHGTSYVPPADEQIIDEQFTLLLNKASDIPDAYEQAFFIMVHVPYLQPFHHGSLVTSRLAANIPLIKANLSPISYLGVPERAYAEGTFAVYESRNVDLLRNVFIWTYEHSCQQYHAAGDALMQTDPIRLRYREWLSEVVHDTVVAGRAPNPDAIIGWAERHGIADTDGKAFADAAMASLAELHEGTISRYGIKPSQFRAWRKQ
jgi:Fic family protein/DNA-binding HxlR family transcriptional regulator